MSRMILASKLFDNCVIGSDSYVGFLIVIWPLDFWQEKSTFFRWLLRLSVGASFARAEIRAVFHKARINVCSLLISCLDLECRNPNHLTYGNFKLFAYFTPVIKLFHYVTTTNT